MSNFYPLLWKNRKLSSVFFYFTCSVVSYSHHLIFIDFIYFLMITAPDVYAIVRCENDTVRTQVFKATGNPEFNLRAIFYRRRPDAHVSIEVCALPLSLSLSHTHTHTQNTKIAHTEKAHTVNPDPCLMKPQLWSRGPLWDSLLGVARLQTTESERSRIHAIDLRGGQSRGRITAETSSSVCLTDLWRHRPVAQVTEPWQPPSSLEEKLRGHHFFFRTDPKNIFNKGAVVSLTSFAHISVLCFSNQTE